MSNDFDAIIIGSGIGGLVCASILAQFGRKRVLVLERHFRVGGYTHTFKRKGIYEWDVGVHYVGEMAPGMRPRAILDYATRGAVDWLQLPEEHDHIVYPGATFRFPSSEDALKSRLFEMFPDERDAIRAYFSDIQRVQNWYRKYLFSTLSSAPGQTDAVLRDPDAALALSRTGEYLMRRFRNPRLRSIAAAQWGDYGVPPSQSAFLAHSNVVSHYRFGGFYPEGGSKNIADAIVPIIEGHGGSVLVNHEVEEILVEDGKAIGVRVRASTGKSRGVFEVRAKSVISNVGAYNTYVKLYPSRLDNPFRSVLESFPQSMAVATAYVGLRSDPRKLGFGGENRWLFGSYDHDENHRRSGELLEGRAQFCFLSFPSLKNAHAAGHTAELTSPIDPKLFGAWAQEAWKRRGPEYESMKERIAGGLIGAVEAAYPGFRELIDFVEVATPLSAEHFVGHPGGAIYGAAGVPERYALPCFRVHAPLRNLFLTGSDVASHGVVGGATGGLMTASAVLGADGNFLRLLSETERFSSSLRLAS